MHKNFLWMAFLGVVALTALWYSGTALYKYYSYSSLDSQTTASSVAWTIQENSEEDFTLTAVYRFVFDNKTYASQTAYPETSYRNRYAAEQASDQRAAEHWKVWYDQRDPHHSSLQKKFPFKECAYAAILWGLVLYFLWIGFYVEKFKS